MLEHNSRNYELKQNVVKCFCFGFFSMNMNTSAQNHFNQLLYLPYSRKQMFRSSAKRAREICVPGTVLINLIIYELKRGGKKKEKLTYNGNHMLVRPVRPVSETKYTRTRREQSQKLQHMQHTAKRQPKQGRVSSASSHCVDSSCSI